CRDSRGAPTFSVGVPFGVTPTPTAGMPTPAGGGGFAATATIAITASASDNGSVAFVDFFAGTNLVGSKTNSPYTITWTNVPVGSYVLIARATDNLGATNFSAPVNVSVRVPTPNFADNFAGRGLLTGYTNFVTGNNSNYTHEAGEPRHYAFATGTNSAWISWIAPESGTCTMDTAGSSFDTVMAVYTGIVVSNLTLVASNDDLPPTLQSQVLFNATAGATYQVVVDSYSTFTTPGPFNFHLSLPNSTPIISSQPQSTNV